MEARAATILARDGILRHAPGAWAPYFYSRFKGWLKQHNFWDAAFAGNLSLLLCL